MADKKPFPSDEEIKKFVQEGGRPDAEFDFNRILKKAAPETKPAEPKKK